MFRKITAILLTIAMLFSISLCACAEENGQPPEPPSGDMAPPDGGNGQPPEKPDGNPPEGAPGGGGFGGGTPPGGIRRRNPSRRSHVRFYLYRSDGNHRGGGAGRPDLSVRNRG